MNFLVSLLGVVFRRKTNPSRILGFPEVCAFQQQPENLPGVRQSPRPSVNSSVYNVAQPEDLTQPKGLGYPPFSLFSPPPPTYFR